jgi:hypothetical protein
VPFVKILATHQNLIVQVLMHCGNFQGTTVLSYWSLFNILTYLIKTKYIFLNKKLFFFCSVFFSRNFVRYSQKKISYIISFCSVFCGFLHFLFGFHRIKFFCQGWEKQTKTRFCSSFFTDFFTFFPSMYL